MALDQRRERSVAARFEHAGKQRLVAMAKVLDVLYVEFVRLGVKNCGRHGEHPFTGSSFADHRPRRRRRQPIPVTVHSIQK
jgi:hypothetical protein